MPEKTTPRAAIERELANQNEPEKMREWLILRKQCLDQDAAQSRTTFWRVILIAVIASVVLVIVVAYFRTPVR